MLTTRVECEDVASAVNACNEYEYSCFLSPNVTSSKDCYFSFNKCYKGLLQSYSKLS